jgi:hypothetical protein
MRQEYACLQTATVIHLPHEGKQRYSLGQGMMKTEYQRSDAWILLAIVYAGKDNAATLSGVIAAADYIQHAVVTFQELEGALARLTAGLYIIDRNGNYAPSEKTLSFYRSVTKPRRPVLNEEDDMQNFIGAPPWSPSCKPQDANRGVAYPALTSQLYETAVEEYLTRMKKRK